MRWKKENNSDDKITVEEAKKHPLDDFIENPSQFCSVCHNPKTLIPKGNLKPYLNKNYVVKVKEVVEKNNLYKFAVKDIIRLLNAKDISDGALQRKALIILVSMGLLKREIEEFQVNDKTKFRYVFTVNTFPIVPTCMELNTKGGLFHRAPDWNEKMYFGVHKEDN